MQTVIRSDADDFEAHDSKAPSSPRRSRHPIRIMPEPGEMDQERAATPTADNATTPAPTHPTDERQAPNAGGNAPGVVPVGSSDVEGATQAGSDTRALGGPHAKGEVEYRANPDLRRQELVRGSHPGDHYVRHERDAGPFRRKGVGVLSASLATEQPRSAWGRVIGRLKRVLIGRPISNELALHERLTKIKALAVFASDPLSSVAYATEEILRVLLLTGAAAIASLTLPIGLAVVLLLAIVVVSYRQTIAAYPRGGGSYIVAKDNLGTLPGLAAAASILIDYTMTVAVSVSAGIEALYSLVPELRPYRVEICIGVVVLLTIANLRGVREAGNIFAVPTYLFIAGIGGLIVFGLLRIFFGVGGQPVYEPPEQILPYGTETLSLFLVLRAFTQGCTALTGVEAISDGVPAFKPPESRNARTTLLWMAVAAISMFSGVTYLATHLHIRPSDEETVLSQIARTIFPSVGGANPLWFYVQIATALILVLAANTAFADFPRLGYFLARDKFMPHQYAFKGDRLAFSWGIITLAIVACVLILTFDGDTTALIPLYTVGVFNSFTLSQAGMVVRWWRQRTPGWRRNFLVNGLGALTTGVVLVISGVTKFADGAWIVIALIPIMIALFLAINRHYARVEREVEATTPLDPERYQHTFIVPVARLNSVALSAVAYARSLSRNVTAVHVVEGEDPEEAERFNEGWRKAFPNNDVPLVIIESPYRSLIGPLLSYIDALDQQNPNDTVTIVVPEFLPAHLWEYLLHNQTALRLKAALLFRPNTVVSNVPYLLGKRGTAGSLEGTSKGATLWRLPWLPVLALVLALALAYVLFLS